MDYYFYKKEDGQNTIFFPNDIIFSPFPFPKSCSEFLEGKPAPIIYIFNRELTDEEVIEHNLSTPFILAQIESLDELKACMKGKEFWKILSFF